MPCQKRYQILNTMVQICSKSFNKGLTLGLLKKQEVGRQIGQPQDRSSPMDFEFESPGSTQKSWASRGLSLLLGGGWQHSASSRYSAQGCQGSTWSRTSGQHVPALKSIEMFVQKNKSCFTTRCSKTLQLPIFVPADVRFVQSSLWLRQVLQEFPSAIAEKDFITPGETMLSHCERRNLTDMQETSQWLGGINVPKMVLSSLLSILVEISIRFFKNVI